MTRLFVFLCGLLLVAAAALYFLSARTVVAIDPSVRVIGIDTPVKARVAAPHGVRSVRAFLEQNDKRYLVFEQLWPSTRVFFFGRGAAPLEVSFSAGKKQAPELHSGQARLVVFAVSNDFRAAQDAAQASLMVVLAPPSVTADGEQHYINQGGSELVTFSVSGYWSEAGVRCGPHTFRSFPLPGSDPSGGRRFSLFAFPWDLPAGTACVVYARNPAGNEATARFRQKIFPKKFRTRDFDIADSFLEKVVPDIDPDASGDLLARFLRINGDLRRQNNQALSDLRAKTEEKFLWSGPFLQLGSSKVESLFADTRNYIYKGKRIDRQTHLGFDLSVTKNIPVAAGNSGKVILAGRLGIYGNCIVIDHGYGLQSIYAHLSEIGVKPGDTIQKSQVIGKSGSTGLAGGDHLHFGMQIDGVQVSPVEWWDEHWISDHILSKVPVK